MAVHPGAPAIQQQRTDETFRRGAVNRPADRRWQRDEDDLAALAPDPQNAVAVLLAEVFDVGADGLEDPQAQEPQKAHQREVERVARLSRGGEHRLELQMRQAQSRGLRRHRRAADILRWRVPEHPSITQVR